MKIQPSDNRILVRQIETDQKEAAGGLIALPSTTDRESKTSGKVVATGKLLSRFEGKTVFYGVFAGEKLKVNEKGKEVEYVLLTEDEVLGWLV